MSWNFVSCHGILYHKNAKNFNILPWQTVLFLKSTQHDSNWVFGSWGPRGLKFIKEIGKDIEEKTGNKKATSHIIQAISMTVQKGNATSIMDTLRPLTKLEDFFDIISPQEEKS